MHIYQQKLEEIRKSYERQVHTAISNATFKNNRMIKASWIGSNKSDNVVIKNHMGMSSSDLTGGKSSYLDRNNVYVVHNNSSSQDKEKSPKYSSAYQHLFLKIEEGNLYSQLKSEEFQGNHNISLFFYFHLICCILEFNSKFGKFGYCNLILRPYY